MPTVVDKPMWVAIDRLDGNKFTRLVKTWHFHVCITVSRQEYVPFLPFDSQQNFRISIRKCTRMHYFEMKRSTIFLGRGHSSSPAPSLGGKGVEGDTLSPNSPLGAFCARPPTAFLTNRTLVVKYCRQCCWKRLQVATCQSVTHHCGQLSTSTPVSYWQDNLLPRASQLSARTYMLFNDTVLFYLTYY